MDQQPTKERQSRIAYVQDDGEPIWTFEDRRARLRKFWDRLPWSWYARAVRRWKKAAGV